MQNRSNWLIPMLILTLGCALVVAQVASGDKAQSNPSAVERGKYLVKLAGCGDCHSPKVMTDKGLAEDHTRLLSGQPADEPVKAAPAGLGSDGWIAAGNGHFTAWAGPWGVSFASNLTSHKKTGLGNWTDEQFIKAMRTGKHRGFGRQILPPMPWFNLAAASDEDLAAILAYLHSLPPIENKVPEPIPPQG
jgi:hypothetical protein